MKTNQFLDLLSKNPDSELLFEYRKNFFVPRAYHITEVKNVHIDSVDCGGRPSEDFQTVVQLWVSEGETAERYMLAGKALKIFRIVDGLKPLRSDADILFEWGDGYLPVSHYRVHEVEAVGNQITIKLFVAPTCCKPRLELSQAGTATACCA